MVTAIIPTYRNPKYLELCIQSAIEFKSSEDTQVICIIDGYVEESRGVIDKFPGVSYLPLSENQGMQYAINVGVMAATTDWVFILNDDNVFGPNWDQKIFDGLVGAEKVYGADPASTVLTINQVEPLPSMFSFHTKDFGRTAEEFDYSAWVEYEPSISKEKVSEAGRIFPFAMSKRWFMAAGGFDTFYKSPFWCDVDFWLKLELMGSLSFYRYYGAHLYHFGSMATKNRKDAESLMFQQSEGPAAAMFEYKWGYRPNLFLNAQQRNNTKLPNREGQLRGISNI